MFVMISRRGVPAGVVRRNSCFCLVNNNKGNNLDKVLSFVVNTASKQHVKTRQYSGTLAVVSRSRTKACTSTQFHHNNVPRSSLQTRIGKQQQHYSRRRFTAPSSDESKSSTSSSTGTLRTWWRSGKILIGIGWTGIALIVLDRYLQYTDRQDAGDMVAYIEHEQQMKRKQLFEQNYEKPTLFTCVVRREYKMGGTHGIKNVHLNDRLEILEERVGPQGYYNLCRKRDPINGGILSIGWYPISFLEKEDSSSSSNGFRWWNRMFTRK